MLEKAKTDPIAIELVRLFVDYCFETAKATKEIVFIQHLLECMDELTDSYADLAFQITREFAFLRNHDRQFVIENHRIAHPPAIRRFWALDDTKIYECRNPILQIQLNNKAPDELNKNFTEVIFAAPVNLLWSFEPNPRSPSKEFPLLDPQHSTNWVYYKDRDSLLGVFAVIILLSCVFLWLEFLQWRESRYYAEPKPTGGVEATETEEVKLDKSPQSFTSPLQWIKAKMRPGFERSLENSRQSSLNLQKTRSSYFRSPYNTLDLVMYLYPLVTSVHQIVNIVRGEQDDVTADFSFCVMITFLHLLAELRVSETVCKYITIVFGILREIKVFFMVFAVSMLFFTIAIVHVLHGVGSTKGNEKEASLPVDFLGAITTVYLMMGGRYDPIASDMYADAEGESKATYKNTPLLVMVMVAFVKADDSWRQSWFENRLRYVESAENMSYHIPGFRETFDWFPKIVYYGATPYQVRQYRRRIAKKDEELRFGEEQEKRPFESEDSEDDEGDDGRKEVSETPLAEASIKGFERELAKQTQAQRVGFLDIKRKFDQQLEGLRTGISQEFQRTVEKPQVDMDGLKEIAGALRKDVSDLQGSIVGLDKRSAETSREISEVKDELSVMKETMSETKQQVAEMKEGIFELQSDIRAILEALRKLQ
ncbi:hypothetical protein BGW38_007552 [Lunasporangiospora selenospora]|uniref:Ion transport domain-containing protein n=1 Tax=Lunasporangiospora selenospora TaxID=979761 RepID=A0A9P6KIH2_9FUNG|nr:hypothetical protein BGW38_007552 [Lunasporangiospora selenospora]